MRHYSAYPETGRRDNYIAATQPSAGIPMSDQAPGPIPFDMDVAAYIQSGYGPFGGYDLAAVGEGEPTEHMAVDGPLGGCPLRAKRSRDSQPPAPWAYAAKQPEARGGRFITTRR